MGATTAASSALFYARSILHHCHIIPRADKSTWEFMRDLHYIPSNAKSVRHEPRNGILMCPTHHAGFDSYQFYIRWTSETNTFVAVNHSQDPNWEALHGNVLHFNTNTKRCPFPTAFLWHEYRVRGFHPTRGDRLVPIKRGGLQGGGFFGRGDGAEPHHDNVARRGGGGDPGNAGAGAGEHVEAHGSGHDDVNMPTFTPMRLEGDSLAAWLKAAREHSSWKDCVVENTSWDGTAAENIEKYQRLLRIKRRPHLRVARALIWAWAGGRTCARPPPHRANGMADNVGTSNLHMPAGFGVGGQEGWEGGAGGEKAQALGKGDEVSFLAYGRIVVIIRYGPSRRRPPPTPYPIFVGVSQPPDGETLSLSTVARLKKAEAEAGAGLVAGYTCTPP
ncbi:hypothetical protein NLJ89_g6533 [Agrocybe chaxingu]|uniref:HNH nuclease domain-containing protein n=1 Tax=Agrocybe chaxingu TaxID=84603 RepID=A0A9W8JZ18_9AGAR|nr:hypothetical protein NLJ89_g6533 [Agrocybe chaxingu]